MNTWIVMCRVSGGVTGTRQAPLKRDGVVQTYHTEAEATAAADQLRRDVASWGVGAANFQYWPEEQQ